MEFLNILRTQRLIAIVRGTDTHAAIATTLALMEEGIPLVEVSLTTTGAIEVIRQVRSAIGPDKWLGAGTVTTATQAEQAAAAGVSFIVTPAGGPGLTTAVNLGIPVVAGALTPTEALAVHTAGAAAVKVFPASVFGPRYVKALHDPFPDLPIVPVGGIDHLAATEYLAAGAIAVGVGSPLIGDAASGGSLAALRERTRRYLDATAVQR